MEHKDEPEADSTVASADADIVAGILEQRGKVYGSFKDKALFIQQLKNSMRASPTWRANTLNGAEREALDAIAVKMARILFGQHHPDNWVDIAGYATLIVNED